MKYYYLDRIEENNVPFKRREKRDISLSQITKDPINLETSYKNLNHIIDSEQYFIFRLKKKKQSYYVKRLLSEILPEKKTVNNNKDNNIKLKTKNIPKPKRYHSEKKKSNILSEQTTLNQTGNSNHSQNAVNIDSNNEILKGSNNSFLPPIGKKIIFENEMKSKENKKMKKSNSEQKLYEKHCNIKHHQHKEKFINHFLTPVNSFINKDFSLFSEEYDNINNEISRKIQLNRKIKKKFFPPKIPTFYSNYKYDFNGYKFKI